LIAREARVENEWKVYLLRGRQWWPAGHAPTIEAARKNAKAGLAEWPNAEKARILRDFVVVEEVVR